MVRILACAGIRLRWLTATMALAMFSMRTLIRIANMRGSPPMCRRTAVAPLIALLLAAAGCGGSSPPATSQGGVDKITVGVIPIVDVAPIYLGKQRGFFSDAKIDLTLQTAQGGAAIVPAVVSGQYQFGFSNVISLLLAGSKGLPLRVVAAGNSSTGEQGRDFGAVVVPQASPIRTAKDLEGRSVAANTLKNIVDTSVKASVRKAGGDPSKVKFTELAFPDMPAALANKRVDAAFVVEPFLTIAKDQGNRVVAWSFADAAPDLMVAAYFTSTKLAGDNPDLVRRFTEAMNKSLAYAQSHPDEARMVLGSYTKIDAATAAKLTLPRWPTEINRQSTDALAQLALGDGLVTSKPDIGALMPG
jgi:NitT/TauT family transport system substrate-binding protein